MDILDFLRRVPKGKVVTYKQLAEKFGTSPRAVGRIMHANKNPKRFPCYKVVLSSGEIGGYKNGRRKKIELLKKDGIKIEKNKIDLSEYAYKFK